jgi:methyl-accepting chemotaxis protein
MKDQHELILKAEENYLHGINRIAGWVMLLHLPVAIFLGYSFNTGIGLALLASVLISSLPLFLTYFSKSSKLAAISYGVGLICYSGLLIHLSRGTIETHFHIFVSLAVLVLFANPWVVLAAAATAAVHHVGFYFLLPASVFNYQGTFLTVVIHALFVIIETVPCMYIAFKFRSFIINQGVVVANISGLSHTMLTMINQLNENNTSLNQSADSQSAAVTQTAQTIHEISMMANQTADNAQSSLQKSIKGKRSADEGQVAVEEMASSIERIKISNDDVLKQIQTSNEELRQIVNVIKQIESKAQIINEIVFQTKLLSFNASVEAARAGEHGKGFAVVAEEVGNLAQMSGNASKEITSLIDTSVLTVENIAKNTDIKIKELISTSQKSIDEGSLKVSTCSSKLSDLVSFAHEIDSKLSEISSASKEQSTGISEMNKVIQELETINLKNNNSIKISVDVSSNLSELSENLSHLVDELKKAA